MTVLANRAGMSSTTTGTGDITLTAALGAVPTNQCSFLDFATAGVTNGAAVSYLVLDSNGGWECGHATYNSTGPKITGRTVSKSSNAGALLSLSGNNVQVYITALSEDIAILDSVPLAPAFDNDTSAASTAFVQQEITARASRNFIINGDFEVWQRGTSLTPAAAYGPDRWRFDSGSTPTVSRQQHTEGQTNVPGATYFMRIAFGATGGGNWRQPIEGLRKFNARQITVSFYAKADAACTLGLFLQQNYGTGGSPTAADNSATQNASITTSWQRFQFQFTVGNFTGKTFGTTATSDYLGVIFGDVANRTLDISDIQLEYGGLATAFERIHAVTTLARCYRYYRITSGIANGEPTCYGYGAASGNLGVSITFPVSMRITPTSATSGTPFVSNASSVTLVMVDPTCYLAFVILTATGAGVFHPNNSYRIAFTAEY